MKVKRLFIVVIILVAIYCGGLYILKNILFPFKHEEAILKYCTEYDLDPYLVLSVMKAESKFDSEAQSHKGAKGLMQITDSTGEWIAEQMGLDDFELEDLYNEETSIRMACWYLDNLRDEFEIQDNFVAAYNAGRGNVNKWLGNSEYSEDGVHLTYIPFKETKKYVDRVNSYYKIYTALYS